MNINVTDKRILDHLSLNARATYTQIAQELDLSRQVVKYRLDALEKSKIIEGYYAILNITRLGFHYHRILFRLRNVSIDEEKMILDYFSHHKNIGWVCQLNGPMDMAIAVWTRSIMEFEEVLHELLSQIGEYIEEKHISIATRIYHLKHKYLLDEKNSDDLVLRGEVESPHLDDLDYNILGILAKTPRKTYAQIGDQLQIKPKVINYRIHNLIDHKIILGFNLKLNHHALGYTHHKIYLHLVNIQEPDFSNLIVHLKDLTSSIYITKPLGMADLEFELMVKSNDEFHHTLQELRYKFPALIKNYTSMIIRREHYINYLPIKK
jgi:DNA-binding Lrp family transcriptional regulator